MHRWADAHRSPGFLQRLGSRKNLRLDGPPQGLGLDVGGVEADGEAQICRVDRQTICNRPMPGIPLDLSSTQGLHLACALFPNQSQQFLRRQFAAEVGAFEEAVGQVALRGVQGGDAFFDDNKPAAAA